MTAEVESKVIEEKKVEKVLVGIRIDTNSRDLLNWAIVKVAKPGDCVVAIYVCPDSGKAAKEKLQLDHFLEDYEDMCNNNKVSLMGQILTGRSVGKVLVKEAKSKGVSALVVGTSKPSSIWGFSSTAGYCVKRLPQTTDVLTVYNGKTIFGRSTKNQPSGFIEVPKFIANQAEDSSQLVSSDFEAEIEKTIRDFEVEQTQLVCENKKRHSRVESAMKIDSCEKRLGWPLLLRPKSRTLKGRDLSVVQWALSLPNRTPQLSPQSSTVKEETVCFLNESLRRNGLSSLSEPPENLDFFLEANSSVCTWFCPHLLKTSTFQFSSGSLIGRGGCNRVYKGILQDGKQVAVKVKNSSKEAWKEYAREVDIISALDHKHVLTLLGVSIEGNTLISVYDYFPKGSLEENLHGQNSGKCALSWDVRFKIAIGIAEALNYLHNECSKPVIHRDVKSSNVLLNNQFEPQLSDFGLATLGPTTSSFQIEEDVLGTFGYLAPEYFMFGQLSDKIDVYAFGVVLLEILSGLKPICSDRPKKDESLVTWARPIIMSENLMTLVDPNLKGNYDEVQLKRAVLAAKLCIVRSALLRPNISKILKLLKGQEDFEKWMNYSVDSEEVENRDDEVHPNVSADLHLSIALLEVDDDTISSGSMDQRTSFSLEDYLKKPQSRSSSFD